MNRDELLHLIDALVTEEISGEEHETLQQQLKASPKAREIFRERMDLETGLRTWATEAPVGDLRADQEASKSARSRNIAIAVAAAAAFFLMISPWLWPGNNAPSGIQFVGVIRQQSDCEWEAEPVSAAGRFAAGRLALTAGVAELSFDSGTDVVLEAPCEIEVTSLGSARLLAGNVFVNVTELSSGFTLSTPEAQIIDEGTEYAVSLTNASAEVHVFDGSVIWIPQTEGMSSAEHRIEAGQARSYSRTDPTQRKHIPFGQRQFVRRLESELREQTGATLLAYDGFENLAGPLRPGRSGFGWSGGWQSGGWQSGGRELGSLASVIDAPGDVVFGMSRSGRRQVSLSNGDDMRRAFEEPLPLKSGDTWFVSFLLERQPSEIDATSGQSLQIALEPDSPGRRRREQIVSFGVTSGGFPFIKSGNAIRETASRIADGNVYLCVLKLSVDAQGISPAMRVYHPGEALDEIELPFWPVTGAAGASTQPAQAIRTTAGENATWQVDELKIGTTWRSVTNAREAD
ncbi:MAG: FecR domain-containing protein [Planctomycetes bacterium]|nr:FecR domain-containing protein [Planctomycetota bacterium]